MKFEILCEILGKLISKNRNSILNIQTDFRLHMSEYKTPFSPTNLKFMSTDFIRQKNISKKKTKRKKKEKKIENLYAIVQIEFTKIKLFQNLTQKYGNDKKESLSTSHTQE